MRVEKRRMHGQAERGKEKKKTMRGHAEVVFSSCAPIAYRLGEKINEMSRLSIALEVSDV